MRTEKKPILSISMLVSSGRTETIRKCMESLLPLRQEIPSELILVDTGCKDESIEIARGYADQVISFRWCNDFSAARNAGLKLCSGEWFLYLDDDEWFEDVSELIAFFKSEEYKKYEAGWYIQRNYDDFEGTSFVDSYAGRMCRLTPQTRFSGKIHECLTPLPTVIKKFGTYVHHYGYVYRSEEERQKHLLRNLTLEEEAVAEYPEDIHMCCQLVQEYRAAERYEDAERVCRETLTSTSYGKENSFVQYLRVSIPKILAEQKKYDDALSELKKLEKDESLILCAKIAVLLEEALIYAKEFKEGETLEAILKLLQIYDRRDDEVKGYPVMDFAYYTSNEMLRKALHLGLFAMINEERYDLSEELMRRVEWNCNKKQTENYLRAVFQILARTGNSELFSRETSEYFDRNPDGEEFIRLAQFYWENHPECRPEIALVSESHHGEKQGFWEILSLAKKHYDGVSLAKEAESFYRENDGMQDCSKEALFFENAGALPVLIANVDLEDWQRIVAQSNCNKDAEELIHTYDMMLQTEELYPEGRRAYFHMACCMTVERVLLLLSEGEPEEVIKQGENADIYSVDTIKSFLEEYIFHQREYCTLLYRPELLSESNNAMLSKSARFAFLVLEAYQHGDDFRQWGDLIKQAAKVYPVMLPVVRRLIEDKAKEMEKRPVVNQELAMLGEQMHEMILRQIQSGNLAEAKALLDEVEKILPGETWIGELRKEL